MLKELKDHMEPNEVDVVLLLLEEHWCDRTETYQENDEREEKDQH